MVKKAAIIGGLGPESTLDYYRGIIKAFKPTYEKTGYPEIIIDSLNLKEFITLAEKDDWPAITGLLTERFNYLKKSGADFGVIASNTPHKVFRDVQERTSLPLISIVTETCRYITRQGIRNVCLLGTAFTMQSNFFTDELKSHKIDVVVPDPLEISFIQDKLMTEIELGIILESTKDAFLKIINRIKEENRVEGVILGCTELPLIIKPEDTDLHYIDTLKIHVDSIVKRLGA